VFEISQHRRGIRAAAAIVQPIVDPQPVFPGVQKACRLQDLEVLGDRGLSNSQGSLYLAHAQLATLEHLHDLDPIGVPQCLHDLNEVLYGHRSVPLSLKVKV